MDKKKAYFIGIAGKAMGQLAKAFKDLGWEVSGSDQEKVYPPISTYLEKNQISFHRGFNPENIPQDANLIVVSRPSVRYLSGNSEYQKSQLLKKTPVLSYPEVLEKFLIKKESIVVAGTYGKTTTSALITWILINARLNPSFMIGGVPLNMTDGVKITDSGYSVVEGDETPSLFESDPSKFMFYRPKYLLITATNYDHPEVFKDKKAYLGVFIKLVKLVPKNGLLVYNLDNVDSQVVNQAKCRKISYSLKNKKSDYFLKTWSNRNVKTFFKLNNGVGLETLLLGKANLENICGAVALCTEIGLGKKVIDRSIKSFKGIKTRLEFLGNFSGRYLYWDFAQPPKKVKGSLQALRQHYPKNRIVCVFDPSMTGLKYKKSLSWYPGNFDQADQVIVAKVGFLKEIKGPERVTGKEIVEAIGKTQKKVFYQPTDERILKYLIQKTRKEEVIVFMSSGGLGFASLIEKTIDKLKAAKK